MALHACPVCSRTFEEPGFCPYDRSTLIGLPHAPAGSVASPVVGTPPVAVASPAAMTQMSMAMPAANAAALISGQQPAQPSQPPSNDAQRGTDPHRTNIDPRRTFPMAPTGSLPAQQPVTSEITSLVNRPAPPPKSEPIRVVSASENPQEVLEAMRGARDSEYDRLVGQTLDGRYHVLKKIGEGGMGVVFSARHAVIERPLAIKVLKREVMRDTATIQRFIQEAKAASRIGHPNIIDVTDFGTTPDGMTYQVMEYVTGQTLGATIRASAPFPIQRAIRVAAQIARALGAAHDKGIVHRDLKPENVFLVDRDGRPDFVKIVDFGIAKVAPVEGQEAGPRLTRAGSVFGTPEYMAPEQAAGRSDTDGRVDIYALGVILYEMLCGRVPHKGDTMVRTLAMQMLDPVEPPSKVAPHANIPKELEEVVLHALVKKREQRYQTMAELMAALERVQAKILPPPVGQSVTGSPVYALAPLPPGADASAQMAAQPPTIVPPPTGSSPPSHAPSQPTIRRAHSPSTSPTTRPKNEPQFVTSEKPITFDHMYTAGGEDSYSPPPKRRWPMLLGAGLIVGGAVGAVLFMVNRKNASTETASHAHDAAVVAATQPDAAIATPPATIDATLEVAIDAMAVVRVPPVDAGDVQVTADARVHGQIPIPSKRDGGLGSQGPVMMPDTPTGRGTIIVHVLTQPETAHVYVNGSYRGPSGAQLEERLGTKLEAKCQQAGYKSGTVSIVFDGKTEFVLCTAERIKTCVDTLANPFDRCPDAGVP